MGTARNCAILGDGAFRRRARLQAPAGLQAVLLRSRNKIGLSSGSQTGRDGQGNARSVQVNFHSLGHSSRTLEPGHLPGFTPNPAVPHPDPVQLTVVPWPCTRHFRLSGKPGAAKAVRKGSQGRHFRLPQVRAWYQSGCAQVSSGSVTHGRSSPSEDQVDSNSSARPRWGGPAGRLATGAMNFSLELRFSRAAVPEGSASTLGPLLSGLKET